MWARGHGGAPDRGGGGDQDDQLDEEGLRRRISALTKRLGEKRGQAEVGAFLADAAGRRTKTRAEQLEDVLVPREKQDGDDDGSLLFATPPLGADRGPPGVPEAEPRGALPGDAARDGPLAGSPRWAGNSDSLDCLATQWVTYLTSVYFGQHPPEKMDPRDERGLRTLMEALDALGRGDLPILADLLCQRAQIVQLHVAEGSWATGRYLELLPGRVGGLAPATEQRLAARDQVLRAKLGEVKRKHTGTG